MAQRTVLKIDLSCQKCKRKFLKSVTALEGVDKIEVDAAKGTVSVTGNADPYKIIVSARKAAGTHADVVSVGPPEAQKKQGDKKAEDQKKKADGQKKKADDQALVHPRACWECQRVVLVQLDHGYNEPSPLCSIM
ncbi:hypothetical protein L484_026742 [Morus notabilis]|uniref:HMA domain-containing protein n=1 Tax=Morus notabilis TaxID=981085 RepID=W9SKQ1_9ROSA|nr:copper transport protein CCH [Morus notabilis]EXC35436.1 hypothetical protein L484_026742 [Morus notabilis]